MSKLLGKKLVICANHSFPHVGGSERVIQQIAEIMCEEGMNCYILSKSSQMRDIKHNSVFISGCGMSYIQFKNKIENIKPDFMLIYSDYFVHWPSILKDISSFNFPIVLIPVGFNATLGSSDLMTQLVKWHKNLHFITHSDNYQDYRLCKKMNIPVTVIPNGIDLREFDRSKYNNKENIHFVKKKYKIDSKNIVLCVSNFFPGKGQEFLPPIMRGVLSYAQDTYFVVLCSSVSFHYAQFLRKRFKAEIRKNNLPCKVLVDIQREHVVRFFFASDVFVFPTQKEVAPLVVLEAMASLTPWVAMPVGNIKRLSGGAIINRFNKNSNAYLTYNPDTYADFISAISTLLLDDSLREKTALAGYNKIVKELNWNAIGEKYKNFFSSL
ncbi:MAG: glycosyltransferase [Candidatus Lokiarchaeota archaeon]|nr:glycosyltransferase [Candidatus Lokiarchaeota archaeon]